MDKVFVYGMAVQGDNFTDRIAETKRLKLNFQCGINSIIISPRRMGKTSLVEKVISSFKVDENILTVFMDIFECRSEYDFYNKFAACVIEQTSSKIEQWMDNAKEFLMRLTPKLVLTGNPEQEYALELNITPKTHTPEQILNLPETIAIKKGKHVVVCIDEFQQIGEMPDSLSIQKRLRSVWQHQQNCSYCLFGSKKHMMTKLFQGPSMPFYLFGETLFLQPIAEEDWIDYIQSRFESRGKRISREFCRIICEVTKCYSSYVQQLSWNVFADTEKEVTKENLRNGLASLFEQSSAYFQQQIVGLSSYQLNLLRTIAKGQTSAFSTKKFLAENGVGSKSNVSRILSALVEKELIEQTSSGYVPTDPIFAAWLTRSNLLPFST